MQRCERTLRRRRLLQLLLVLRLLIVLLRPTPTIKPMSNTTRRGASAPVYRAARALPQLPPAHKSRQGTLSPIVFMSRGNVGASPPHVCTGQDERRCEARRTSTLAASSSSDPSTAGCCSPWLESLAPTTSAPAPLAPRASTMAAALRRPRPSTVRKPAGDLKSGGGLSQCGLSRGSMPGERDALRASGACS
jgi:hypothetical protein